MQSSGQSLEIVARAEMGVELGRIRCPVPLQIAPSITSKKVVAKKTHVVRISIVGVTLDVQGGGADPYGVVAHPLDVVETGDERLICPAAVQAVSGVAWRVVGGRREAVGD